MKTLVIGIDGADYEYWVRWAPPWLCTVPLESQIGLTGSEWTSMFTGIPVTALGAYDYYGRIVGDDMSALQYADLEGYYWWEIAEPAFSTAICRAPACYPPRPPKRGWILSGIGSWDKQDVFATSDEHRYPAPRPLNRMNIRSDPYAFGSIMHYCGHESLIADRGRHRLGRLITGVGQTGMCNLARRDGYELIEHMAEHSAGCDLGFIYFGIIDILLHNMEGGGLHTAEQAEEPHRLVLDFVQALRDRLRPEHLIIISDHGGSMGHHRSCGILAWTPTETMPAVTGTVRLGTSRETRGGPRGRIMDRVPVLEAPWHPWTYDVAEFVLRSLDLKPKRHPAGFTGQTGYAPGEEQRMHKRLKDLGYL